MPSFKVIPVIRDIAPTPVLAPSFAAGIFFTAGQLQLAPATAAPGDVTAPPIDYVDLLDRIDQGCCIIEMLFDDSGQPNDYRFLAVNTAFRAQTGLDNVIGRSMRAMVPGHEQHWCDVYGRVAVTGEPIRFEHAAAQPGRHYEVYAFRTDAPHLRRVAILFNDISERKQEKERLALISAEIDHRARNLMALTMAMIRRTDADAVKAFKEKLSGRIQALATSQQLISRAGTHPPDLAELVRHELASFEGEGQGRIFWQGPDVPLRRTAVQSVALALHELATNAVKYGALSGATGRLDISWSWLADGRLELHWLESDGPELPVPTHRGTGTTVIAAAIERQLGGELGFDWRPRGVLISMILPASALAG